MNQLTSFLHRILRTANGFGKIKRALLCFVCLFACCSSRAQTSYSFSGFAGDGTAGSSNGKGTAARFFNPKALAVDAAGNIYVADTGNHTIRKITPVGEVTTLAGVPGKSGGVDGVGGLFSSPSGVAVDKQGNIYVADAYNYAIRMVTPAGVVSTFAGKLSGSGNADGEGSDARFSILASLAVDTAGNLYVTDAGAIRKVTPDRVVTTLAGSAVERGYRDATSRDARFYYPSGIAVDSKGNVYVADRSMSYTIRKITPAGVVTTLAGSYAKQGFADGTSSAASFWWPSGLAIDREDNIYVTEDLGDIIRKVSPVGVVTTVGGVFGQDGFREGIGSNARFLGPSGITVDLDGNLYVSTTMVSDRQDPRIIKGTPLGAAPWITAQPQGATNGAGTAAVFSITAHGPQPLSYQWKHAGVDLTDSESISGSQSNILTLSLVRPQDAGNYSVVVSNAFGSITSTNATLVVDQTPRTAAATLTVINGFVVGAVITDGGWGYSALPALQIIGGGGTGADAVVGITNRQVVSIEILNPGSGYTNAPTLFIDPPTAQPITLAIAGIRSGLTFSNLIVDTSYLIQATGSGTLVNIGEPFTATNDAYFLSVQGTATSDHYRLVALPVGVQAQATAQVAGGFVVGATLVDGGSGYTTPPVVTILNKGSGSNASAVATLSNGIVTEIVIKSPGSGYKSGAIIVIDPPPANALAPVVTLEIDLKIDSLLPLRNYQLQFAPEAGAPWTDLDSPFQAVSTTATRSAPLTGKTGFFRLHSVP